MSVDLTTETPAESRAALRAELAQMRAERDEARGEVDRLRAAPLRAVDQAVRDAERDHAQAVQGWMVEEQQLRAEVERLRALVDAARADLYRQQIPTACGAPVTEASGRPCLCPLPPDHDGPHATAIGAP